MTRVFLGRLPPDVEEKQVSDFFRQFRSLGNITLKAGYGFVDFDDARDAEEAVSTMHNQVLGNDRITVEFARERKPRDDFGDDRRGGDRYGDDRRGGDRYGDDRRGGDRYGDDRRGGDRYGDDRRGGDRYGDDRRGGDRYGDDRRGGDRYGDDRRGGDRYGDDRRGGDRYGDDRRGGDRYGDDRRGGDRYGDDRRGGDRYGDERRSRPALKRGYRVNVFNLSSDVSWQDLKDFFGKEHGFEVNFADAHKRNQGEGIVEFLRYDDLLKAMKDLNGSELRGSNLELKEDEYHNRNLFEKNGETYPGDSTSNGHSHENGNEGASASGRRSASRSPRRSPVRESRDWEGETTADWGSAKAEDVGQ